MLDVDGFDGFMPSLDSINISNLIPMLTTEGELIQGYTVKLCLGDSSEVVFSCSEEQLQKIFFTVLKAVS